MRSSSRWPTGAAAGLSADTKGLFAARHSFVLCSGRSLYRANSGQFSRSGEGATATVGRQDKRSRRGSAHCEGPSHAPI